MAGDAEGGAAAAEEPEEKESMWKTCLYCCLDSIAVIVRTIVAIAFGIRWTVQRCCYPIKESCFSCIDRIDRWYSPYKCKKPYLGVPGFQFGGLEDSDATGPKMPRF
mmetsp:Transcript_35968/g.99102  ORF Transcript_35968/g.99102 Transcript_35968/m.99102 type:complete len:107 (+) Transcript_35968:109-429(+)